MSRSLNKVQLIGNLGGDPEVRTTSNGSKVANFNVGMFCIADIAQLVPCRFAMGVETLIENLVSHCGLLS